MRDSSYIRRLFPFKVETKCVGKAIQNIDDRHISKQELKKKKKNKS